MNAQARDMVNAKRDFERDEREAGRGPIQWVCGCCGQPLDERAAYIGADWCTSCADEAAEEDASEGRAS